VQKEEFIAEPEAWWLVQRDLDDQVETCRRDLGTSFGWTDPLWYRERTKVADLYTFIEQQANQYQLLEDLDRATESTQRQQWLIAMLALKTSAVSERNPPVLPTFAETSSGPEPRRKSAFGARSSSEAAASGQTAVLGQSATSHSEPSRKLAFGPKVTEERRTEDNPVSKDDSDPALIDDLVKQQIEQAVTTVISDLSANDIARIADDLGISSEELEAVVHETDFVSLVTEEAAKLSTARM
jgi:hypothetical protein